MEHRERFTEITGDRNPLHYEEELAKHSRFGGIIVQGASTSGLLNAVVAEDLPGRTATHWFGEESLQAEDYNA